VIRVLYTAFGSDALTQDWSGFFAILAAITMTFGNLAALGQSNVKRLLGYSTVAQAGYMLVGVAAVGANSTGGFAGAGPQAVLYYLGGYAFTNLAVFFVVIAVSIRVGSSDISAFNGLGRRSPMLAILMTVGVISLLGIPPTVGFMSKVAVFGAAVNTGLIWLAVLGVINSFISAYYYLKIIRAIFFEQAADETRIRADAPILAATTVAAAGAIVLGAAPWPLLRLAERALTIL
jgi:NADH-quinone oxidoreductase subunit N